MQRNLIYMSKCSEFIQKKMSNCSRQKLVISIDSIGCFFIYKARKHILFT